MGLPSCALVAFASWVVPGVAHGATNITLLPLSSGAAALDGSPYGFYHIASSTGSTEWTIDFQGGGWCMTHSECIARSLTDHGSSTPLLEKRHGCSCMNTADGDLADDCNCIFLPYLDGASFAGFRDEVVHVEVEGHAEAGDPTCSDGLLASERYCCAASCGVCGGNGCNSRPGGRSACCTGSIDPSRSCDDHPAPCIVGPPSPSPPAPTTLHVRGLRNLEQTLEYALAHLGLAEATEVVVTGASAGGNSAFLHVDRISEFMQRSAPNIRRTIGAPTVGYFLDHANWDSLHPGTEGPQLGYPHTGNYSSWIAQLYELHNVTSALSPACIAAFPSQPHLCFMSPHAVPFIGSDLFVFNSKHDLWQMQNDLQVPCFKKKTFPCAEEEQSAVIAYGDDFLDALAPVLAKAPQHGAFITSCICHSCNWSSLALDGKSANAHYVEWHDGTIAPGESTIHIDRRAPNGGGELDADPTCEPFPGGFVV